MNDSKVRSKKKKKKKKGHRQNGTLSEGNHKSK